MLKYLLSVTGFFVIVISFAQTSKADFNLPEEVCTDENIAVQNNSIDASTYLWDFCIGDLTANPVASGINNSDQVVDGANNITVVESNGDFFGFVASRYNGKLIRMDFGDNLDNTPQLVDLGNIGNLLLEPIAVELVKENGIWYGFLIDFQTFKLFKLNFGNSLKNIPLINVVEQNVLNKPVAISVIKESNELILKIANFGNGNMTSFNFGSSLTNTPVLLDYNITSRPIGGISFIKENGIWYGLATEFKDRLGRVLKLKYNNGLNNEPVIEAISSGGVVSNNFLSGVSLAKEGGIVYGFIQTWQSSELYRLSFTNGLDQAPAASENLGNLGVLNNVWGIKTIKKESTWRLFTVKTTGQVLRISFPDECNASYAVSDSVEPKQVFFNQSGNYAIDLTTYDEFGNRDDTTQFITVTEDQAPLIDFQPSSQCFGNISTITSTTNQPLTSATWTINNETRTGETITYDFPTPGTYPVTLEVESANGCGNRLTKEITIYEPPVPNFTTPAGQVCTNGVVNFTNTTNTQGADSLITYQWFVNDSLVSEAANPAITFAEGGAHTVRLEAGIPGCTETTEQTINVLQGPTVRFNVAQICQGEPIAFENLTTGEGITGYAWDFGDGGSFSSVAPESPTYAFAEAGTYSVALTVSNALGCQNVYRQEVTVFEQPSVGFLSDVACVGTPTQFTDTTTAGTNANVIAWQWDFGDGLGTAAVRNPTYAYPQAGTYQVKLIAQTTAGCTDSAFQTVTVESPVAAGFTSTPQCTEDSAPYTLRLTDTSVVAAGDAIDRWFWTVNGENFVSSEVTYAFPAPGTYAVSLTAFAASGCNATVTQAVRVDSLPQLSFATPEGCTGEPLAFRSEVVAFGQEITGYAWNVAGPDGPGVGSAFEVNPTFTFAEPGTYAVTLTVTTADECTFTTTQSVTVAATPMAAFTASPNRGGAPLEVTFENTTTDATQYAWDFSGLGTSTEENPTFTFTEVGPYVVTLTATNGAGCTSTTQQTVEVVVPVQDLRLDEVIVSDNTTGDAQQILVSVSNQGSLVASGITVTVNLDEAVTVQEPLTQPVLPGETIVYPLRFQLPIKPSNLRNPLRYLCVSLEANETSFAEENPDNNRQCLSLNQQLNVEAPFPNPARDQLRILVILPTSDAVALRLMSQEGKVLQAYRQEAAPAGLNTFLLNVKGMPVGAYLLQVTYQGKQRQFRVAVGP